MSRLETSKQTFKAAVTEIKAFLCRQRWKEALIFSAFILLSFGFWVLLSLQEEYETTLSIPVTYQNVPPSISFSEERPEQVIVRVKDKGSALLNYTFKRNFQPVMVDMKDITAKEGIYSVSREQIASTISKQLLATTAMLGFLPQEINLPYSAIYQKEVPVYFDGKVRTLPGFLPTGETIITPSHITIYATKEVLDTIQEVKTVYTELLDCDKTLPRNIKLQSIPGVNMETGRVSVIIPIEEYTEKTLVIPVVCEHIPPHYTIRIFPPEIRVTCHLPMSRFKDLTEEDLAIHITYEELEQGGNEPLSIDLTKKPDWIHTYALDPGKIEYILEKKTY